MFCVPKMKRSASLTYVGFVAQVAGKSINDELVITPKVRHAEYKRSLASKTKDSALSEHVLNDHPTADVSIIDFKIDIIDKCKSPLETRLTEGKNINQFRPEINRKHEKAHV